MSSFCNPSQYPGNHIADLVGRVIRVRRVKPLLSRISRCCAWGVISAAWIDRGYTVKVAVDPHVRLPTIAPRDEMSYMVLSPWYGMEFPNIEECARVGTVGADATDSGCQMNDDLRLMQLEQPFDIAMPSEVILLAARHTYIGATALLQFLNDL